MQRKNFSFRFEWQQAIAHLEPAVRLEIYEQTVSYAATGSACFQTEAAEQAFNEFILPDFRRREKAAAYRARRKAAQKANESDEAASPASSASPAVPTTPTIPTPPTAPTALPRPNRRERRWLEAQQRRLQKRRQSKALRKCCI